MPHLLCIRLRFQTGLLSILTVACCISGPAPAWPADEPPLFERDVLPVFAQHCLQCHGLEHDQAKLDLRTMPLVMKGGTSGPVLVKGSPQESPLFVKIAERSMPPAGELPLTDEKIETVRRWIEAGAQAQNTGEPTDEELPSEIGQSDRDYWAFRTPVRNNAPPVEHAGRVRTPVDAFLLHKLQAHALTFSPDAEPRALVRRAYLDLIGLPPSPGEVAAFVSDRAPDAYERLIDRLLASPHFGERWGRHWLDAAGYADVQGTDNDFAIINVSDGKWRYRDYVVRSLNADKPFDRFMVEQLAGDELVDWRSAESFTPEIVDLLVATGFLRAAADSTGSPELNTADIRHQVLTGTLDVITTNLLGLTVGCARCHSHKFDPIPQRDYYALQAIFTPAFNPQVWLPPDQRQLPDVSAAEKAALEAHNAEVQRQIDSLNQRLAELRRPYEERLQDERISALPEAIRADVKTALQTAADQRSEVQKYLADKLGPGLQVAPEQVAAALSPEDRAVSETLQQQLADLPGQKRGWGVIQAVYDVGPPSATYLMRRGDYLNPGIEVEPGFVSVLCQTGAGSPITDTQPAGTTSGRRLALARWLTAPGTPAAGQMARVMVNRVWQHLFGVGIVATTENFGYSGVEPTHPELLDWLAADWIEREWRLKPLIKMLMMSTAYRQSATGEYWSQSDLPPGAADPRTADPGNELLWRMRLRRLEAEIVRDAVLAVSGRLDRTLGGPAIMQETRPDGTVVVKEEGLPTPTSKWRRSLYMLARRNYHLTMLAVFDQPLLNTNCTRRDQSAVVLQSLTMMNDAFVVQQARRFADRVGACAGDAPLERRIELAFAWALGRPPRTGEIEWSRELLGRQSEIYRGQSLDSEAADRQALVQLCQMLLGSNEFLYVH